MPIISAFFGIVVRMYYREHGVAHFHAEYQGQQATFNLDGEILAGYIRSRTALRLIRDWAALRRRELEENWRRVRTGEPLEKVAPLE